MPQQKAVLRDRDPGELLERAGEILKCDVEDFRRSFKIGKEEKDKRDLLLYILWELGIYSGRNNKDSDLGIVWKSNAIIELIESLV